MDYVDNLSPYIRHAIDQTLFLPWNLRERVIVDYELLYIKEGRIRIIIEDTVYIGTPGNIFLIKPGQRHSISILSEEGFRQPHLHFDLFYQEDSRDVKISFVRRDEMSAEEQARIRKDCLSQGESLLPNHFKVKDIRVFEQYLFEIIDEFVSKMPYYELSCKGLFIKLWTYILRENHWHDTLQISKNSEILMQMKEYLEVNKNRAVELDELADKFGYNKYYMCKIFKKTFHISPIRYNHNMRLDKARQLITTTEKSFSEISDILGFENINIFSRSFKQHYGLSPTAYRYLGN